MSVWGCYLIYVQSSQRWDRRTQSPRTPCMELFLQAVPAGHSADICTSEFICAEQFYQYSSNSIIFQMQVTLHLFPRDAEDEARRLPNDKPLQCSDGPMMHSHPTEAIGRGGEHYYGDDGRRITRAGVGSLKRGEMMHGVSLKLLRSLSKSHYSLPPKKKGLAGGFKPRGIRI